MASVILDGMVPQILLCDMSNVTNVSCIKPAREKLNAKLFREMSIISVVFDALKNINASPENSLRDSITRLKSMLLREVGIWPESLL